MVYQISDITDRAQRAVASYNGTAAPEKQICTVSLFGSYADGNANEASDIDLLVRFGAPCVSLFTLARAHEALETALGKPVDLVQDPLPEGSLIAIDRKVLLYG